MNSPFVPIRRRFMALAVLCGLAAPLAADQFGDFTYTSNGSAITITGYTGAGGAVSIPATINSLPVTAIGAYAFQNKTAITSVVVPNGVTGIDTSAFQGSAGLAEARFIGNAPTMGASVFASTAPGFTVYFIESGTGFTTPSWQGFPAVPVDGFYLVNGSFEQGPTISGWGYTVQSPNSITIPGWTVSRNNIDIVVRATWSASNGNRSIDMNGNNIGEMYQDVGGLTPGVSYLLEFDFGGSPHVGGTDPVGDADPIKDLRVAAATTVADFQFDTSPYRMNASGTVPAVGWTRKSVTFTARNATERITFTSMDPASSQRGPLLDNVILTAAPLLRDYGITGYQARIVGNRISWWLPRNMDLGSLAPTFTSPAGASATPPSGTVRDFTAPQSYVLRSADGLVTKTYTVTAVPFSIWGNDSSGLWNTTGQWVNGAVPNGADNMADFGAIDVTTDRLVTVDTPVSINRLVFGDAAPVTAG